jgi:hypothetical protein
MKAEETAETMWQYLEDYGNFKVWLYCDNIALVVYEYVVNGKPVRLVDAPE